MSEGTLELEPEGDLALRPGLADRWARARLRSRLAALEHGALTLVDADGRERFGARDASLHATVRVMDPRFYRALALRGAIGGAEAYMDGSWKSDDPTAVVRILVRNRAALAGLERGPSRWLRPSLALFHALRRNTRLGSRRNIAAHYDLGNAFFELFLDPTLTYSSGIFESAEASMEEASIAKYERVCRKLGIGPGDHVLEIGTGWGGFALHAASRHGCRVTTATISRCQVELARRRVAEAGLEDLIEVVLRDYRDLAGEYDKLVSIEMVEAVGHAYLDEFIRTCSARLVRDGAMLLQAITVPDAELAEHVRSIDFIKRYIFPGGELVSVGALAEAAARVADLRLTHLEDLTPHYAETLRRWRRRMAQNLQRMRDLGLDERFLRMWEFYLCYCEGGFDEREIGLVQVVFEKRGARRPSILGALEPVRSARWVDERAVGRVA